MCDGNLRSRRHTGLLPRTPAITGEASTASSGIKVTLMTAKAGQVAGFSAMEEAI